MAALYRLKVHPGSKEDKTVRLGPDRFEVWTRAPAERGRANEAALALLAGALGVEAKRLRLVKGTTSPSKLVQLLG